MRTVRRSTAAGPSRGAPASLLDQFDAASAESWDGDDPELSARRRLEALIQQLFDTTPQSSVALAVMQATDDERVDARRLAALIEQDPFLALRVLRLANTAYYGLQQRVSTVWVAVSVIGFGAVRAMAAMVAMGITDAQVPEGFLDHSAKVAVGASHCAALLGEPRGEAFSGGLLHDVGEALLYRCAPGLWRAAEQTGDPLETQARMFGLDHQTAAHLVLQAWQLPHRLLDAVGRHHDTVHTISGVARTVAAGEAVCQGDRPRAIALGVPDEEFDDLSSLIDAEAAALHAWLRTR